MFIANHTAAIILKVTVIIDKNTLDSLTTNNLNTIGEALISLWLICIVGNWPWEISYFSHSALIIPGIQECIQH